MSSLEPGGGGVPHALSHGTFVVVEAAPGNTYSPECFREYHMLPDRTGRYAALYRPVHFSGLAVDMDGILGLAKEHGLRVIEDAAHAIGTRHQGRLIGSFGDLAVFSFHPNKNMTCIEGGAIVTADAAVAAQIEQYRFHGIVKDEDGGVDVKFCL